MSRRTWQISHIFRNCLSAAIHILYTRAQQKEKDFSHPKQNYRNHSRKKQFSHDLNINQQKKIKWEEDDKNYVFYGGTK